MISLIRMRLSAYLRTQLALAPLLATLAILGVFYGGGRAEPAEAYGVSAVILFPVFAWQVKILLDVEPEVQRQIAATALGSPAREIANGLVAGTLTSSVTVIVGLVLPWLVGGVSVDGAKVPLLEAMLSGTWVHLLAVPPAVALGALASRAISRTAGAGALILVTGGVLAIVLGLKGSPVSWLMPPLMAAAREVVTGVSPAKAGLLTAWALAWAAVVLFGYFRLRRTRP